MAKRTKKHRSPSIVLENGTPVAVILGIRENQELLERVEDVDDLAALQAMRQRPLQFRSLDEFLSTYRLQE